MPGRYAIVEEPEALEVVDDDVYHPDQSVTDPSNISVRSLEPIVAGPIGLKTVFFDPRWTPNQRKTCVVVMAITSCCCFAILVALFVGLGKVLNQISRIEAEKQQGLYLIPNFESKKPSAFYYASKKNGTWKEYVDEIDKYLNVYWEDQEKPSYTDCKQKPNDDSTLCKFDRKTLGENCVSANNYGYSTGSPCLLFAFRNIDVENFPLESGQKFLPMRCKHIRSGDVYFPPLNFTVFPAEGFDTKFLPRRVDGGIGQNPPLVMVQLINPDQIYSIYTIECGIDFSYIENEKTSKQFDYQQFGDQDKFKGVLSYRFEFDSALSTAEQRKLRGGQGGYVEPD